MKVVVKCDGNGNNELIYQVKMGNNIEEVRLYIEEIKGIKYRSMQKQKTLSEAARYRIINRVIEGYNSISVNDLFD